MVRRFYIVGGNNPGDPAEGATTIVDPYFEGKEVTGVFKEGFGYYIPLVHWNASGDTINILTGVQYARDEVIAVEVRPLRTGTVCSGDGSEVTDVDPYLPEIIKCVVARVNTVFETRDDDPFSVHYDRGLYEQVGNDRFISGSGFLLIWLVMPFTEEEARDSSYFKDATCKIVIATTTERNYTQDEREDINFHPRLLPVYKQFIYELKQEQKLDNNSKVEHGRMLLPYHGGGDVNSPGQPNLWKNYVDCIILNNVRLKIENMKGCTPPTNYTNF